MPNTEKPACRHPSARTSGFGDRTAGRWSLPPNLSLQERPAVRLAVREKSWQREQ